MWLEVLEISVVLLAPGTGREIEAKPTVLALQTALFTLFTPYRGVASDVRKQKIE